MPCCGRGRGTRRVPGGRTSSSRSHAGASSGSGMTQSFVPSFMCSPVLSSVIASVIVVRARAVFFGCKDLVLFCISLG